MPEKFVKSYKIEVYLPEETVLPLLNRVNEAGACRTGNYDLTAAYIKVTGCWRPLKGSTPLIGKENSFTQEKEMKLEFCCPEERVRDVLQVIKENHPYEEPVYNVFLLYNSYFEEKE